jgi:hypothetical protein
VVVLALGLGFGPLLNLKHGGIDSSREVRVLGGGLATIGVLATVGVLLLVPVWTSMLAEASALKVTSLATVRALGALGTRALLVARRVDMPKATVVAVGTRATHGVVLAELLAGRVGGMGGLGRSGGGPRRPGAKDSRVGLDKVLQVGNYLVPGEVLLLRQLERLDGQLVVGWQTLEERKAHVAGALGLSLLEHEVAHLLDVSDVGREVGVVFELGVGELPTKLVERDFILLEVSASQLAENALDMATLDRPELLGLGGGHVALEDAPSLLAARLVWLEVKVVFDSLLVIRVEVCLAGIPQLKPPARVEEVLHEGPPGLEVFLASQVVALEESQHDARHGTWGQTQ